MLDIRRLRLLRELHVRGTVTAVADALAYTPSAVSQQLAALEREAGVALLVRHGRGVRLTDAGRDLVEHADAVLARIELAQADLNAAAGTEVAGRVRVAAFQTASSSLVVPLFATLPERYPKLRLELHELDEESLDRLQRGEVDLAIVEEYAYAPRARHPSLEWGPVCRDRLLLVVPEDHPRLGPDKLALADLRDEPWVAAQQGTAFADSLVRACRRIGGFDPVVRHRTNDMHVMEQLVAAGQGVALIPSLGQPGRLVSGLGVRECAEESLERAIVSFMRRASAGWSALHATAQVVREQARAIGMPGA